MLIARSCSRLGGKDVVGDVKGVDVIGVRIAGRGVRDRGDRREEVEINPNRRSLSHDVPNFVLETSADFGFFAQLLYCDMYISHRHISNLLRLPLVPITHDTRLAIVAGSTLPTLPDRAWKKNKAVQLR